MPRPPKWRVVGFIPEVTYFKPAGVPLRQLEEVCLTVEEMEAIRLKDLQGLDQEICAEKMDTSRPTFQRILSSARIKIAQALIEGKAIRIEGGHYKLNCRNCGRAWPAAGRGAECPYCHTSMSSPQNNKTNST